MRRSGWTLCCVVLLTGVARPHDLWLVPSQSSALVPSAMVEVDVAVGMDFPLSDHAMDPTRISPRALGPDGSKPEVEAVRTKDGTRTFLRCRPEVAGTWMVGAVTARNRLEMLRLTVYRWHVLP